MPAAEGLGNVAEIDFANFEGIGVPARTAWFASATLFGTGGITLTVLSLATNLIPKYVAPFSGAAIVMAGFCLIGAKRYTYAWWGAHLRSIMGLVIITGGAMVMGDVLSATALVIVYPMLSAAFVHDSRRALPYVVYGALWLFAALLFLIPDPSAHAIATGTIIAGIAAVIMRSQMELRSIVRINRDLSTTDALTGVANVRQLREQLEKALAAPTPASRIALFGMDLDDFKRVNDEFSHTRGDEVLRAVATEIAGVLDGGDLLARRGGDEFAVLARNTGERDLVEFEQRIRDAITRGRNLVCPEINPQGSVAYVMQVGDDTVDTLLERCDAALHEAKLDAHPERRTDGSAAIPLNVSLRARPGNASARADFRVGSTTDAISNELQMARAIRHALGNSSSWNVFSVLEIASALALLGALSTNTGADLASRLPSVAALGLLFHGGAAIFAGRKEAGERWIHLQLVVMVALISAAVWSSGPLAASFADLYFAPAVCAVYAFGGRRLLPYLASSLGLFVATLVSSDYAFTIARISLTSVMLLVIIGMLAKARRMTREFTAHAVRLSTVDPLTGTANLRGMRRGVSEAIEHCGQTGEILALVSVDLDEFKLVNDLHSHTIGDKVLVIVAEAMASAVRRHDMVARRGGDEFAIVCTVEDENELEPLRARLDHVIRKARTSLTPDITSTASIGIVVWRRGESVDTFLARADEELHGAKESSRETRGVSAARRTA